MLKTETKGTALSTSLFLPSNPPRRVLHSSPFFSSPSLPLSTFFPFYPSKMSFQRPLWRTRGLISSTLSIRQTTCTQTSRCFSSQFPGSGSGANQPPRGSIPMPYITEVTVCQPRCYLCRIWGSYPIANRLVRRLADMFVAFPESRNRNRVLPASHRPGGVAGFSSLNSQVK